jgi:serine/threonine protein kinase/Tol biopolymer transport system component
MIGTTLGHYQIRSQLGKGGMGEVYVADDVNLNRKVALKFLPEAFAGDPERMARFEREARLLASLNHPNIAAIYGLEQAEGKRFIVMELVEGETLAQRIGKGALPVEDALAICRQIAEGLEAAHEKGVIHRDLKPANVMITEGDKVKILDFGLAKALSDEAQTIDSSQSPTLTEAMTRPGVILGTAAYMSPEQAKGKSVDKRADIWAFGCILYECLAGKRAFEGETITETLAAVLKNEPEWDKVPAKMHHLLRRCLEKDPKKRLRDIGDAFALLETAPVLTQAKCPWLLRAWAAIATLLVVVLAIVAFLRYRGETPGERIQFQINPSSEMRSRVALSPDGRMIAYVARTEGSDALFIHEMQSGAARKVEGTDQADYPFWSPDSRSIAFFAGGMLKRIEVSGGLPRDICPAISITRGAWNKEGTILFAPWNSPLHGVSAMGGKPSIVTALDKAKAEMAHLSPSFLPDGRHYLYGIATHGGTRSDIYAGSLDSTQKTRLLTDVWTAAYADPGYLLFYRGNTLFAQPFDAGKLAFTGEEAGIAQSLRIDRFNIANLDVSQTGVLVYCNAARKDESRFVWLDRTGKQLGDAGEPGKYQHGFDLSMDGRKIAVSRIGPAASTKDIWIIEWERNVSTRFTFESGISEDVVWSPDGRRIAFTTQRKGNADIYEKPSSGSGEETPLVQSPEDEWIEDWSRDGRYIAYALGLNPTDLYAIPLFGDRKPFAVVRSPFNKDEPHFSFDGKWLAYASDESGAWQVYVVSFPAGDGKRQISTHGGAEPRWRGDGKELYYLDLDGKMMAVDIGGDTTLEPGIPHELFDTGLFVDPTLDHYAVTPDGGRFLILKLVAGSATKPINVILNWTSLIKK